MDCKVTKHPHYTKKNGHQIRIRARSQKGQPHFDASEYFDYEMDAVRFRDDVKKAQSRGECIKRFFNSKLTVADLVEKTLIVRDKSLTTQEKSAINQILKHRIANVILNRLSSADVIEYARELLSSGTRKPQTVSGYISYLGNVLRHAKKSCRINIDDQCVVESWKTLTAEELIDDSGIRDQTITDTADDMILEECEKVEASGKSQIPYSKIYRIVLAQSLRRSALIGILKRKHIDFDTSRIKVDKHKNKKTNKGEPQWCPLMPETESVLRAMGYHENDGVDKETIIFPFKLSSVTTGFRRIVKKCGLSEIQIFRDGRRTAITTLDSKGLSTAEIKTISTHSSKSRTLEKVYIKSPIDKVTKKVKTQMPPRKQKSDRGNNESQQASLSDMMKKVANSNSLNVNNSLSRLNNLVLLGGANSLKNMNTAPQHRGADHKKSLKVIAGARH